MGVKIVVLWSILSAIGDLVLTTYFYLDFFSTSWCLGCDVPDTDFGELKFDFWVLSLIRLTLTVGFAVGSLRHRDVSLKRINWCRSTIILGLATLIVMYSLFKLLLFSDVESNLKDYHFWVLFATNIFCSVVMCVNMKLVVRGFEPVKRKRSDSDSSSSSGSDSESEPLLDPVSGARSERKKKSDVEKQDEEFSDSTMTTIVKLLKFLLPDMPLLILGFFFLVCSASADIFLPFYTGKVIDDIAIQKSTSRFTQSIIVMALISIASAIAAGFRGGILSIVSSRANVRIRMRLFEAILRQEVGFFDALSTGDLTSRLTADTETMSDSLSRNVNILLRNVIRSAGTIAFMIGLSWQLSLITVIGMPVVMGVSQYFGIRFERLEKRVHDELASTNNVAEEVCSSMRTVRSFSNENGEVERYRTSMTKVYRLWLNENITYGAYIWATELFALGLIVGTLYYGGHLVVIDRMTGGHLISFILYQFQLGDSIEQMGWVFTDLMKTVGASRKVLEFIEREPKIQNVGTLAPDVLKGHIEFKDVHFNYPARKDQAVLQSVSFEARPGQVVALVGPSGGGKSSCVSLIEHFFEPNQGEVLLDGQPVKLYDHKYLHQKVALVSQEPVLYARAINENISYGCEGACREDDIHNAAKSANAHHFVMEMKKKYKTNAGEKGTRLSGGQKQRIAIARALVRKPVVLLLDEATSALDAESEYLVQQAIYKNLGGRTVIIVAHRLSTIENADMIICIDKGHVVEKGKHLDLIKKRGMYWKLVQRQMLAPADEDATPPESPPLSPLVEKACLQGITHAISRLSSSEDHPITVGSLGSSHHEIA